jgi:hypothetical protein
MSHPSAPRHVSPSQWLRTNCLPSMREHCVCTRSYLPVPINLRLRLLRLCPQSQMCEESAPGPMCPRLESGPDACAPVVANARRVRARLHASAPGPTRPRPLARVRAQRGRAFTSGRMRLIARATSTRPQSFPAGVPCSRVRPQQYINPFAPPHKSLYS